MSDCSRCWRGRFWTEQKCLDRVSNVLQAKRTKLLESEINTASHMIPDWPGNADASRRTFGLEPDRDIHGVAMQVGAIGDRVTEVDADTKPDRAVGWLVPIQNRN